MVDHPSEPDTGERIAAEPYRGMPQWVKVFLVVAIVLAVLALVAVLTGLGGPGGGHGPGRHIPRGIGIGTTGVG